MTKCVFRCVKLTNQLLFETYFDKWTNIDIFFDHQYNANDDIDKDISDNDNDVAD